MIDIPCRITRTLSFPSSSELLRRLPAVFAFHPPVRFFQKQLMVDPAAYRALHIISVHASPPNL